MEFNNTALTNDAIIQNCESLSKLGNGGISGNTVLMAKFTGWVNDSYGKVAMAILRVDKNWRWDDFNWAAPNAVPVATCTLVDGQRDYILPRATNSSNQSTLWKVYKVRIKDINGEWYDLSPLGSDEDETDNGSGVPEKYRLLANSIRLSDTPSSGKITLSGGIQVWFQREFSKFTTSSTTQMPGFMSAFHYLIPLDASATYLLPNNTDLANEYIALFKAGMTDLETAYSKRNDDPKNTKRMTPNIESCK